MEKNGTERKGLGLKVLSVLIIVMFVSVAVICPVVRCDDTEASTNETNNNIPNEVLNEFIADELDSISKLTEDELMEEYGVTLDEYQESMSALSGTTMSLIGDENGEIRIEVCETIDSGRSGGWTEGLYFNFGIDSVAWSAIKWWFSDDCINMITDQMCQGEINAVAIAEKELQDEIDSLQTLTKALIDIGNTINAIKETIKSLDGSLNSSYSDADALADEIIQMSEQYNVQCKAYLSSTEDDLALMNAFGERLSMISMEDLVYAAEASNGDAETCAAILEEKMGQPTDAGIGPIKTRDYIRFTSYPGLIINLIEGNYTSAAATICSGFTVQGINYISNYYSGKITEIKAEYNKTLSELNGEKIRLKNEIADNDKTIGDAKKLKSEIRKDIVSTKKENDGLNNDLKNYEKDLKKANGELEKATNNCRDAKITFDNASEKYKNGLISLDDYKSEMSKYYDSMKDFWSKKITHMKANVKVIQTKRTINVNNEKISTDKELKISKSHEIIDCKIKGLKNKAEILKKGLGVAKAGVKAAAKATAKAGCKALICSTGIGTVIMIALDIVMALLIKFIEDHLQSWFEDYGIIVKIQTLAHYTICHTIRILWRTITIYIDAILPCIPRLDGVYMQ